MTDFPADFQDLLDKPTGALTTIGPDGVPRTSLVWFVYDDGKISFSLSDARLKTKDLLRNDAASFLITDGDWRYLDVRGHAKVEPDFDYAWADAKVAAKYDGAKVSERDQPGDRRYVVTIEPTKVYAVNMAG